MLVKGNEYWVTKDKQRLRIRDIEDSHLVNILRFVRRGCEVVRRRVEIQMLSYPGPSGDAACDAFDAELNQVMDGDWRHFIHKDRTLQVQNLEEEAERRGLEWE